MMPKLRNKPVVKLAVVAVVAAGLAGCASTTKIDELNAKIHELEEKVNAVALTAGAAKVDAATALMISTEK